METRQDGASAAGPRDGDYGHGKWCICQDCMDKAKADHLADRRALQESQPAPAPAAQGEDFNTVAQLVNKHASREQWGAWERLAASLLQPPASSQGMREAVDVNEAIDAFQGAAMAWGRARYTGDKDAAAARLASAKLRLKAALSRSQEAPAGTPIEKAARALIAKLDAIHADPQYVAVWQSAHIHMGRYNGPQYVEELSALRASLSGLPQEDA